MRKLEVFPDANALAAAAADAFALALQSSRGPFRVALSGGNTPKILFAQLVEKSLPWDRLRIFWSDERCVGPDDGESNYRMANEAFLSRVAVPREHIHRIQGELPDAAQAAKSYQELILAELGPTPVFDLIYLGMGPDGHTASLFPGTPAVAEKKRYVVSNYVESKKAYRVTFTLPLINSAKAVHFLVAGPDKADTARKVLNEAPSAASPASLVSPSPGNAVWFLDQAAASRLKS